MSRLIDADALKRKAQRVATESWKMGLTARIETTLNQFIDWIDNVPTVQPEIISCFECIHYKPMSSSWGKCYVHSSRTERYRTCQSCDYCSWAERRTE